jgi:hypothetical protein
MQANGNDQYDVVVHSPTPAGNNSAGVAWSEVLVNSLSNVSSLPVGSGGGRISNNENNAILAGTVFETRFAWTDLPTWTNPERAADLNSRAAQAVTLAVADFQRRMRFFGHEVA